MVKPGSDAGMPGIEDSEVGKNDEAQFGKQWVYNIKGYFSVSIPCGLCRETEYACWI